MFLESLKHVEWGQLECKLKIKLLIFLPPPTNHVDIFCYKNGIEKKGFVSSWIKVPIKSRQIVEMFEQKIEHFANSKIWLDLFKEILQSIKESLKS